MDSLRSMATRVVSVCGIRYLIAERLTLTPSPKPSVQDHFCSRLNSTLHLTSLLHASLLLEQGNSFSFGVAVNMRKDYGDGFGLESGSVGIIQKCTRKATSSLSPGSPLVAGHSDSLQGGVINAHFVNDLVRPTQDVDLGVRLEAGDTVWLTFVLFVGVFVIHCSALSRRQHLDSI